MNAKTVTGASRPEDCATAWFAVLERAIDERDVDRAFAAQRELRRLGVDVRFRRRAAHAKGGDA